MLKKAVKQYYKFFDETIQSSTFIVLIISVLILLIGTVIPSVNAQGYMKATILESSNSQLSTQKNIVLIDGISYEVNFLRVN